MDKTRWERFIQSVRRLYSGLNVIVGFVGLLLICALLTIPFIGVLLTAREVRHASIPWLAFQGVVYLFVWLVGLARMADAFSFVYNVRRPYFIPHGDRLRLGLSRTHVPNAVGAIGACLFSYALTLYGFAVLYVLTSHIQEGGFHPGPLGAIDGLYFSTVTAATVGYGDIYPVSTIARLLVMAEIAVSLFYAIFLFSVIAGIARGSPESKNQ